MQHLRIFLSFFLFATVTLYGQECQRPSAIASLIQTSSLQALKHIPDVRRNIKALNTLCVDQISFQEGGYKWKMLLVTHPKAPKGAFWFLPHDDERTAFDAAVYATQKYGGGFLAVMADDQRNFQGQDPNRNFGDSRRDAKNCRQQNHPAPRYGRMVFSIIDTYRTSSMPYLALHNNKNGWYKNGGSGGVSMLKPSSIVHNYPAYANIGKNRGLNDEDSLVYIAGKRQKPDQRKLNALLRQGLNTKYEVISHAKNDCSLSNYVVLTRGTEHYYNIEAEHGDIKTQKKMIDKLMRVLK